MKPFVLATLFLGALSVFVVMGVIKGSVPVLPIAEVRASKPVGPIGVDEGVIATIESRGHPLRFTVKPKDGGELLVVESPRIAPQNFKPGNSVSLRGYYKADEGKFIAEEIFTACPSKYEAARQSADSKTAPAAYSNPGATTVPPVLPAPPSVPVPPRVPSAFAVTPAQR